MSKDKGSRLVGWASIGAAIGLTAAGVRARAAVDEKLRRLIRRTAANRPYAWSGELLSYDSAPRGARR